MTGYITKFEKNKIAMSLMVKDKNFLKITTKYGKKIERLMSIDFDSKTIYGEDNKYIKTKIKTYKESITTNFYNKNMLKEKVSCKCLSICHLNVFVNVNVYQFC